MPSSRPDPLPAGQQWCTVHQTLHPETDFNWKNKSAGICQSRCRAAQAVAAAASYRNHVADRRAAVAARRKSVTDDLNEQLRKLMADVSCVDCGAPATGGLLASMPAGLPTPAEAIRRQLAGVDLADLVIQATWRCRTCAGGKTLRRERPLHKAARDVVTEGGEWTVDDVQRRLVERGVMLSIQHVRNLLAALCADGEIQRFTTGVYRLPVRPRTKGTGR